MSNKVLSTIIRPTEFFSAPVVIFNNINFNRLQLSAGDTSVCKRKLYCFLTQYGLLNKYGGALFTQKGEEIIAKAETYYDDYKTYDWFGEFLYSAYRLEKDLFSTNLSDIKKLKIPVYFILGRHDWNLPTSITVEYSKKLIAPK